MNHISDENLAKMASDNMLPYAVRESLFELQERRRESVWIPRDSETKPNPKPDPTLFEEEVLIHHNRPQTHSPSPGRYSQAREQWRFRGENTDSTEYVIGWRRYPNPEY